MAITFAAYLKGEGAIKPHTGLVLGWVARDYTVGLETRYALYETGKVVRGQQVDMWSPKRDIFEPPGSRWLVVDAVPENAEFVGYYQPPRLVEYGQPNVKTVVALKEAEQRA